MPTIADILNARRQQSIFDRIASGSSSSAPAPAEPSIFDRLTSEPLPMEGRLSLLPAMVTPERGREWAVPGVLAGAWNAFTAPGRALQGQELGPEEALNVAGTAMLGGMPVPKPGAGGVGLNVFHGSPHKFDKFDISKIGTGEGAQAYGHGLYFAENPGVARDYQRMLTKNKIPDVEGLGRVAGLNLSRDAQVEIQRFGNQGTLEPMAAARALQATNAELQGVNTKKLASLIEQYRAEKGGSTYKVDLPDEHIARMLDWDKPLSQQPANVQESIKRWWTEQRLYGDPTKLNGEGIHGSLMATYMGSGMTKEAAKEAATQNLRHLGIPGIRYLDQGSRTGGKGTSNFVVFSDDIPKIIGRE